MSRRNWVKAGLVAGPVVLMRNRPTFAATSCAMPSAWMSTQFAKNHNINLSHTPASTCGTGCSPGWWKQAYNNGGKTPATCRIISPQSSKYQNCYFPPGDPTFNGVFGSGPLLTFGQIFWQNPSSHEFHFACAYLNAQNNGKVSGVTNYPLSPQTVIAMYKGTYTDTGGTLWTQTDAYNYLTTIHALEN